MTKYQDSVLSRSVIPNIKYALAAVLWDTSPVITVNTAKMVLRFLDEAETLAKQLRGDKLCVASDTRLTFEVVSIDDFVADVQAAKQGIALRVGSLEELNAKDGGEVFPLEEVGAFKLFSLHF